MRNNNKLIMALILAFALVLSGCSIGGDTNRNGFLGGGSGSGSSGGGVDLEYGSGGIQPQKGEPFSILFNVKNYQLHPVNVEFRATGFEWDYVSGGISSWKNGQRKTISAASETSPGQLRIILENNILDGFTGDFTWNPTFKYCYEATSTFRQQVCVPNSIGASCENKVDSTVTANGPLSIKIADIIPVGDDSVKVEFSVSNSKGGIVVNKCFQDEIFNDYGNKFSLGDIKLGTTSGRCNPVGAENYVINKNSAKFVCDFNRNRNDDLSYETQVVAEIKYNYQQQTKQNIFIRDLTTS